MRDEEEFLELVDSLKQFSEENLIVVEGKKDVAALKALGVKSKELNGNNYLFAEKNSDTKQVLLLTDFDEEGEIIRKKLKEAFSANGVEENVNLRKKFWATTRLSHIEGLKPLD